MNKQKQHLNMYFRGNDKIVVTNYVHDMISRMAEIKAHSVSSMQAFLSDC